jgi:hypothetical protein
MQARSCLIKNIVKELGMSQLAEKQKNCKKNLLALTDSLCGVF